jgi:hypothetical protein
MIDKLNGESGRTILHVIGNTLGGPGIAIQEKLLSSGIHSELSNKADTAAAYSIICVL